MTRMLAVYYGPRNWVESVNSQTGQYRREPCESAETLTTISQESRIKCDPKRPARSKKIGQDIVSSA